MAKAARLSGGGSAGGGVIAHGQIRQFAADFQVVLGDQPTDWAFLGLSGNCQLRRNLSGEAGPEILHTFKRGETFGGFLRPNTMIVAAEDSTVFCIRLQALMDIAPKVNGHGSSSSSESLVVP